MFKGRISGLWRKEAGEEPGQRAGVKDSGERPHFTNREKCDILYKYPLTLEQYLFGKVGICLKKENIFSMEL